jgi:hypothetical protein
MAGADKALDFREVQSKVMVAQPMPNTGSSQRDLVMRLGQLLGVVGPAHQWINPGLTQTRLEQMQDHLRIARIVFILRVVHRLARARKCQRGNQPQTKTLPLQKISQRSMVVASRFETD